MHSEKYRGTDRSHFLHLISSLVLLPLTFVAVGEEPKPAKVDAELVTADQLFRAGRFAEAELSYQAILGKGRQIVPAQIGLVRAILRQQKLDESLAAVNNAIAANPKSAGLLAAKGDVEFRLGKMSEAEDSYLTAKKIDPKEAHAYLGLARLYDSYSLHGKAYDLHDAVCVGPAHAPASQVLRGHARSAASLPAPVRFVHRRHSSASDAPGGLL